jgi:hypothetical protein
MKEKDLQRFAVKLCAALHLPCLHVPNVITRRIGGKFISIVPNTGNQDWPDLIILGLLGRTVLLELKTETGNLSEGQEKFRDWCIANRHTYILCRDTEGIESVIKQLAQGGAA